MYVSWILLPISIWFIFWIVPVIQKHIESRWIQKEIGRLETQITTNSWTIEELSMEWKKCEQVQLSGNQMAEWIRQQNNNLNLKINELKIKYNNINGFIEEKVSL